AGDLDGVVVAEFAAAQGTAERIGLVTAALLAAGAVAGAVLLTIAVARLHGLGEALRAIAQRLQRAALCIHRAFPIAFAEPAGGIAHLGISLIKAVLAVALIALLALLALLAGIAALALVAALLGAHATLGQVILQLPETVAQRLLVLLQVAHALVALLAAH